MEKLEHQSESVVMLTLLSVMATRAIDENPLSLIDEWALIESLNEVKIDERI